MESGIAHRGPDGRSLLGLSLEEQLVGAMVHRRLAIVDEGGGAQPFESEGVVLVANAEIYGHRALRQELQDLGFRFRSQCDVEVILHGYRAWGEGVLERIDGMFAFALWDASKRTILLGRDRLGQKPLYWALESGRLLFASEASAVRAGLATTPRISRSALRNYLLLDFVPSPACIFEGVQTLGAGQRLRLDVDTLVPSLRRYYRLPATLQHRPALRQVAEQVQHLFDQAAERRRMADRPVGLLLSGGVDSTLVASSLVRPGEQLRSYSVGFDEPAFDESAHAQRAADWLGLSHTRVHLRASDLPEIAHACFSRLDEPLGDPSLLAVWAVARRAAEDVKVLVGGDGADELFGGYDVFIAGQLDRWTAPAGKLRGELARYLARFVPATRKHFGLQLRLKHLARGLCAEPELRPMAYLFDLDMEEVCALMGGDPMSTDSQLRVFPKNPVDALFLAYATIFLESDILTKVDRGGMAHGVEIRSPFLDHELATYVASLPSSVRLPGLHRKALLHRALGKRLPRWVRLRKKQGFSLPLSQWMHGPVRSLVGDALHDPYLSDLLEPRVVQGILARHERGAESLRKVIWNLTALSLWYRGVRQGT